MCHNSGLGAKSPRFRPAVETISVSEVRTEQTLVSIRTAA